MTLMVDDAYHIIQTSSHLKYKKNMIFNQKQFSWKLTLYTLYGIVSNQLQ